MDNFVPNIKEKYQERLINQEKQWPPCLSNKLVKLELVERQDHGIVERKDVHCGRKDEAVKRSPIPYSDLFKNNGDKKVRRVLVEGDAGIGKTSLSVAISEDWSHGRLFQEFKLLLLLPLRHKVVASVSSLPELLGLLHKSPADCDSVAAYMEEREGRGVLIIADGWDELSQSHRNEDSFLFKLFFELDKLPFLSVVVTSRPSASHALHKLPCIDRFVNITGFRKEDITEYIKSEFPNDPTKADRLLEQVEHNPLIESVCSIPLSCAIICHLWRALEDSLPKTMTELYTKITLNIILRNIQKQDSFKHVDYLHASGFKSLPEMVQPAFWKLCEFAFKTLDKDQLIFSQDDLDKFFPDGLQIILCFGLLQSVAAVLVTGRGLSFNFLHLSFQEFLAALHLANQSPDKQLETVKAQHTSSQTIDDLVYGNRFNNTWRFFFGICFNSGDETEHLDIKTAIQCIVSSPFDHIFRSSLQSICHCAFEAQHRLVDEEVIHFRSEMRTFNYPSTAHDYAAMLYVYDKIPELSGMTIDFGNSRINEKQIEQLTNVLKHGKLQVCSLSLSGNKLSDSCVSKFVREAACAFPPLKELIINLSGNEIGAESIRALALIQVPKMELKAVKLVGNNSVQSINAPISFGQLNLRSNPLGLKGAQAVGKMLATGDYHPTTINLSRCRLTTNNIGEADLPSNNATESLEGNVLRVEAIGRQLCDLPRNESVICLTLDGNNFSGERVHILTGFMCLCVKLHELSSCCCRITSDDLSTLVTKLESLQSSSSSYCRYLHSWRLSGNEIGNDGVLALDEVVTSNSLFSVMSMDNVELYNTPMLTDEVLGDVLNMTRVEVSL